jgi:hypothetical protein
LGYKKNKLKIIFKKLRDKYVNIGVFFLFCKTLITIKNPKVKQKRNKLIIKISVFSIDIEG